MYSVVLIFSLTVWLPSYPSAVIPLITNGVSTANSVKGVSRITVIVVPDAVIVLIPALPVAGPTI